MSRDFLTLWPPWELPTTAIATAAVCLIVSILLLPKTPEVLGLQACGATLDLTMVYFFIYLACVEVS